LHEERRNEHGQHAQHRQQPRQRRLARGIQRSPGERAAPRQAGVDVFHPVQKGTMDEGKTARDFGKALTFLVGVDVQHVLQEADPEGVRAEVRNLIDIFDRPEGGMCIAAGNGILPGTPFENIEAFLDEAVCYGAAHRRQWQGSKSR